MPTAKRLESISTRHLENGCTAEPSHLWANYHARTSWRCPLPAPTSLATQTNRLHQAGGRHHQLDDRPVRVMGHRLHQAGCGIPAPTATSQHHTIPDVQAMSQRLPHSGSKIWLTVSWRSMRITSDWQQNSNAGVLSDVECEGDVESHECSASGSLLRSDRLENASGPRWLERPGSLEVRQHDRWIRRQNSRPR